MISMAPLRTNVSAISKRLLAGVGLGDQELVGLHPQLLGIDRVKRVLGIDKGGNAAGLLHLGNKMQRNGRFPRGLGAEDLGDAARAECRRRPGLSRAKSPPSR